ncbi:MAG: T9SS type A sorting domain-containing protein [Chitinophagaceae bacterium]|nr:MAG: T9SS type A sorting domain-containing protein [Chitinophagaceae bacterium]
MKNTTAALLLTSLCLSFSVRSQGLYKVAFSEKSSASSLIFEGTVVAATSYWNEQHTMIYTSNLVKPSRVFKGQASREPVEVITMGGQVDNFVISASELLVLEQGTTGVFFCHPNVSGIRSRTTGRVLMDVYASSQGFIRYDLASQQASTPFDQYSSIESAVYPQLEKSTGRKAVIVDPSFNLKSGQANTASKIMAPAITSFSPATVIAGKFSDPASNTLTISGSGFGAAGGSARVAFDDSNDGAGGTPYTVSSTNDMVVSWTDGQIVIKVPGRAGTGSFTVYDAANTPVVSPSPLNVSYAILNNVNTNSPSNQMYSLFDDNGLGGYSYYYSTSTANSGADFSTAAQEAPFRRAITTWQQTTGLNFTYGGLSTSQTINLGDGVNLVMMDNTANGPSFVLPAGVLAVCYSGGYLCNGSAWIVRAGFEIIIRNQGVSTGSASFNNGPCATTGSAIDMESVILHELGHALNLGHIIDSYKGSSLPNIDPQKVMNFAIVNGVDRRSPDWSALTGALYNVNPRNLAYCFTIDEMTPLPGVTLEPKDECPLVFPSAATAPNTAVSFDLDHATSNLQADPQYTRVLTGGQGTAITNNAWYVIRTNGTGTSINLTISNYTTNPADQAACSGDGVELSFYQVNSCPAGQAFPAPVAYRSFSANGPVTAVTGLSPNTNYLVMADGLSNTRALFTMTVIGNPLPLRFIDISAVKKSNSVLVSWITASEYNNDYFEIESSTDGLSFYKTGTMASAGDNAGEQAYSFDDRSPFSGIKYYRIRQVDKDAHYTYSKVVSVNSAPQPGIIFYPNPVTDRLAIRFPKASASFIVSVYSVNGNLVRRESVNSATMQYSIDLHGISAGVYIAEVKDNNGIRQSRFIKR